MTDSKNPKWTTVNEIMYLRGLGKRVRKSKNLEFQGNRKALLRNYIKAGAQRVEWGDMDRGKCLGAAVNMLVSEYGEVFQP